MTSYLIIIKNFIPFLFDLVGIQQHISLMWNKRASCSTYCSTPVAHVNLTGFAPKASFLFLRLE